MHDELVAAFGLDVAMKVQQEFGPFHCDAADSGDKHEDPPDWFWCSCVGASPLMPNAVGVPGACHIAHNAAADMTQHIVHFSTWWDQIKNLEALLTDPRKMRRIIAVIEHGAHHYSLHVFRKRPPKLYQHRWAVLQKFLHIAWPQVMILRLVWHTGLFGEKTMQSTDANTKAFNATMLEKTLHSPLFLAYFRMVQVLQDRVQHFPGWCEGCTCHLPGVDRAKHLSEDYGKDASQCPLQNMRLPELVAASCGCASLQSSGMPCSQPTLQPDASIRTTPTEWELISRDFAIGMDQLDLMWIVKVGYATSLPWLLAGLSHHMGTVATVIAKRCLLVYDKSSEEVKRPSHILCTLF